METFKKMLVSENKLSNTDCDKSEKVPIYIKTTEVILIVVCIWLLFIWFKPYGCDKMYMDEVLIEDKLYQLRDQFIERKINHRYFYLVILQNIHPFYDGNGRTCKILFTSNFS